MAPLLAPAKRRTRQNDLPLIAVPRLLLEPRNDRKGLGSAAQTQAAYQEIEALNNLSILAFPPERIASSLVDLWQDLVSAESCEDFLRYHRGWIAHAVLLGCCTYNVIEVIERVIEVACCLDLLCQEHLLAVTTIESLKHKAVSRLTAWEEVQAPLIQKMNEITQGCLAHDVTPESRFRASRDSKLEYWILSRAFVQEEHLMAESLAVQSQYRDEGDVETRITNLEAMLLSMTNEVTPTMMEGTDTARPTLSETELSGIEDFTDTDTEKSIISSSDTESLDDRFINPVQRVARQTRDRIALRLEDLKNTVHSNAKTRKQTTPDIDTFSIPASKSTVRSIDPLDQRTIFRISATTKDGKSGPRRPRPTATYTDASHGARVTASSIKGKRLAARDLHPGNDGGRWKKNVEYAPK